MMAEWLQVRLIHGSCFTHTHTHTQTDITLPNLESPFNPKVGNYICIALTLHPTPMHNISEPTEPEQGLGSKLALYTSDTNRLSQEIDSLH